MDTIDLKNTPFFVVFYFLYFVKTDLVSTCA